MPQRLKHRQEKIQEKRKKTPWREFVMEVASRFPMNLHRRDGLITIFPDVERAPHIVDTETYNHTYSDQLMDQEYRQGNPLDAMQQLFRDTYKPHVTQFAINDNCEFGNFMFGAKNAYLSFIVGDECEDILYSSMVYFHCDHVYNSVMVSNYSSSIYGSFFVSESQKIFYSSNIHNSADIWYSSNMIGCHHCFACTNLENQSYCIKNKQYTKEEYFKTIETINLRDYLYKGTLHNLASEELTGTALAIYKSSNIENGVCVTNTSDSRNIAFIGGGKHGSSRFYDTFEAGVDAHDFYAVSNSGTNSTHLYCSSGISQGSNSIYYSYHLDACSYCFGCVGLRNKSYCIFNKQYEKEERHDKIDEIFFQMEQDDTLGQFFPSSMNPFYFNDTAAYLIDDTFTKEEVTTKGYLRRDEPIRVDIPEGATVVKTSELDQYEGYKDSSADSEGQKRWIDPEILKVIIQDEEGNVYRVIPMEYDFLLKHGLPLPRKHRLDRIKEHFSLAA